MNHSTIDDNSEEGLIDDLDALLENELALVDENVDVEPEIESEVIKTESNSVPFFDEFDGVMAQLLASSKSMFVGQESEIADELVEVLPTDNALLDVTTVDPQIKISEEVRLKDLPEDEQTILLQLMELIVESVDFSNPVVSKNEEVPSIVESVECNLKLFDEEHNTNSDLVIVDSQLIPLSTTVSVPLDSDLQRLQEMTERLIQSEEALGQAAIEQVDEELQRETEKIAERNRKREKQRQLAHRNAMATRIQCWMRKIRAKRKVQKLREFTQRKRAVELIQQQRRREAEEAAAAAAEADRRKAREEQEEREAREREQRAAAEAAAAAAAEAERIREEALRREREEQEARLLLLVEMADAVAAQTVREVVEEESERLAQDTLREIRDDDAAAAAAAAATAQQSKTVAHSSSSSSSSASQPLGGFDLSAAESDEDLRTNHRGRVVSHQQSEGEGEEELEEDHCSSFIYDSMDSTMMMSSSPHHQGATSSVLKVIEWDDSVVDVRQVQEPREVVESRSLMNKADYSYLDSLSYQQATSEDDCGLSIFALSEASADCLIRLVPESQVNFSRSVSSGGGGGECDLEQSLLHWQQTASSYSTRLLTDLRSVLALKQTPSKPVRGKARGVYYDATDFTKSVENVTSVEDIGRTYPNLVKLNLKVNLIRGLKGLESLFRLTELNLNDNRVESVSELSQLRSLQSLQMDSNSVRNIECLNDQLPHLTFLSLSMNKLSVMPHMKLPSLKRFELHHNELKELPRHCLEGLPSLTLLDLGSNKLRSIDGEVFTHSCPLLQSLILSHNALVAVPAPLRLPLLKYLWLSGNQITELKPWSAANSAAAVSSGQSVAWPLFTPMLQRLVLTGNQITHLDSHVLSTLPLLADLDLSFNAISSRHDITALREAARALQVLHIGDNRILNTVNPQTVTPESGQFKSKAEMQRWLMGLCPQLKRLFDEDIHRGASGGADAVFHSNTSSRGHRFDSAINIGDELSLKRRRLLQLLSEFQAASLCANAVLKLSSDDKPLAEPNADVRLLTSQYQTLLGLQDAATTTHGVAVDVDMPGWKEPSLLSLCRPVPLPVVQLIALQSAFRGFRVRRRLHEALASFKQRPGGDSTEDDPWGDEEGDNSLIQDMLNIDVSEFCSDFDADSGTSGAGPMVYGDHIRKRKNSKRSMDEFESDSSTNTTPATGTTVSAGASGGSSASSDLPRIRGLVPALVMDDELSRPASASSEISNHSLPLGASAASTPYGASAGEYAGGDRLHHYSNMSPLSSARSGVSGIADMNHSNINNRGRINPNSVAAEWDSADPGVLATLMRGGNQQGRSRVQDSDNVSRTSKNTTPTITTSTRVDLSKRNPVSMSANTSNYVTSGSFGGKVIHVRKTNAGAGKKVKKPAWLKGENAEDGEEEEKS